MWLQSFSKSTSLSLPVYAALCGILRVFLLVSTYMHVSFPLLTSFMLNTASNISQSDNSSSQLRLKACITLLNVCFHHCFDNCFVLFTLLHTTDGMQLKSLITYEQNEKLFSWLQA